MKRIIFFVCMLFLIAFPMTLNAECDYEEQYKLNVLGSNITYSYEYVKDIYYFDVTLYNIKKDIYIKYNGKEYNPTNERIVIKNYSALDKKTISIYASNSSKCSGELINDMTLQLPYYNKHYNKGICKNNNTNEYCAKFISSSVNVEEIDKIIEENEYDPELENYLKNRKSDTIIVKIKKKVLNIVTSNVFILSVVIVILILLIIVSIKKLKSIKELRF